MYKDAPTRRQYALAGFMAATRVLISDDHVVVRRGLRTILEGTGEFAVCGEAADGRQTLHLATQLTPEILILDISMPPPNGLEVAAQLRQTLPDTKILFITMHDSEEMLRAAAAAGASGYLLKSDAEELLLAALSRLEEGRSFVSPAFNSELARELFD
jgi:two-component system response regulator NreC